MRTVLIFAVFGGLLVGAANRALAQTTTGEEKVAQSLVHLYLQSASADGAGTRRSKEAVVGEDTAAALEKIGSPAVRPLLTELQNIWKGIKNRRQDGASDSSSEFKKVARLSLLLGRFVPFLAKSDLGTQRNTLDLKRDVRTTLVDVAQFHSKAPTDVEIEARMAAVEVLGKIYAQKGAYLLLERKEVFVAGDNAENLAKEFRNQTRDLKAKFVARPKKGEEDKWNLEKQLFVPPEPAKIAELLLDGRNLQRCTEQQGYSRLFIFMSELERAGKEKSLRERVEADLAELEANLRVAATGFDPQKKGKEAAAERRDVEAVKAEGWLRANRNIHDLCMEMENIVETMIPVWKREKEGVMDVLNAFDEILDKEKDSRYGKQFLVWLSVTEATGRIYAGD